MLCLPSSRLGANKSLHNPFFDFLETLSLFITSILKSLVVPVIWLALIGAIYSRIAPFFALNRIFFPVEEEATLKTKQPIRLQGLFKVTDQIAGRWKTWRIMWQILQLLFPKLLFFPPKKWMTLIPNWLSIVVINIWTDQVLYLGDFKMDVIKW